MKIFNKIFGSKIPLRKIGERNPFTNIFEMTNDNLVFCCPSCRILDIIHPTIMPIKNIDPIYGAILLCDNCKNINHIPRGFTQTKLASDLKITCGVKISIKEYHDWYFHHPIVLKLHKLKNEKYLENFDKFCVWAFCFKCKHQFPKGVIQSWLSFLVSKKFGAADSMFAPLNAQSAADFKGLEKGHCSKCNSNDLIVIINDLPDD